MCYLPNSTMDLIWFSEHDTLIIPCFGICTQETLGINMPLTKKYHGIIVICGYGDMTIPLFLDM